MNVFRPNDLFELREIKDIALAPDGSRVVYVQREFNRAKDQSFDNLWLVSTNNRSDPIRLTRGLWNDRSPIWSSDGTQIAFLSNREDELEICQLKLKTEKKDKRNKNRKFQIWILNLRTGGEPRQITYRDEGVESYHWAPDGKRLVFASRDPTNEQKKYLKNKDPIIVNRLQHKYDGKGFLDNVHTHLFTVEIDTYDDKNPRWSPDGSRIVFVSNRTKNPDDNEREDLWIITPNGGKPRRLTNGNVKVNYPRWSPDGNYIAFVSSEEPENYYRLRHLMVIELKGDGYWIPTKGLNRGVSECSQPLWSPDSKRLYTVIDQQARGRLVQTLACSEGTAQPIFEKQSLNSHLELLDTDDNGSKLVFTLASPGHPRDIYTLPTKVSTDSKVDPIRLTWVNEAFLKSKNLAKTERLTVRGANNDPVEVLVNFPPDFDGRPHPTILWIHGGPMSYDAPAFSEEVSVFTGQGYLVLQVNYHGSTSYGENFTLSIRGNWGRQEQEDFISVLNQIIDKRWADPNYLYIGGISYGGILTNWMIGYTNRFRAAVSERGESDYFSAFGTDDMHIWFTDELGLPWKTPENYQRISPIRYVEQMNTPVLFIEGAEDCRCPLSNAEQLYVSLRKRGIEAELVVYPGEGHSFKKPSHRVDRLQRILDWFARHRGIRNDR